MGISIKFSEIINFKNIYETNSFYIRSLHLNIQSLICMKNMYYEDLEIKS